MAEGDKVEIKKPLQQGVEDSMLVGYYDIMVIGRTGMGKSTTVDKLLIANITGQSDQDQQTKSDQDGDVSEAEDSPRGDQSKSDSIIQDFVDGKLKHEHMTMWLISDDQLETVSQRLKNLVFFSAVENPHKEVNQSRKKGAGLYAITNQCELLSNELTKIRVLDIPGFFGQSATCSGEATDAEARAKAAAKNDLSTMRKVLRIKSDNNLLFRRVVYFLPDRGTLERTSGNLVIEIEIMAKYFGRAIFDSMVVVATHSPDIYRFIKEDTKEDLFPSDQLKQTHGHLKEALKEVFKEDIPDPPIIFISLFDTCEDILLKVQKAKVKEDEIDLAFSNSVCARCGSTIHSEGEEGLVSSVTYPGESGCVPYDESVCHPMMIPKYSKVEKFFGGIAHVITFFRFEGRWPSFANMDEVCACCNKAPKSRGCCKVGSKYFFTKEKNSGLTVDHSASVIEPCKIEKHEEVRIPIDDDQ